MYEEVCGYPVPAQEQESAELGSSPFQVPLRVRTPFGELSMFSTMATFGAPADVTLPELAIELFYPLDEFTTKAFRALAGLG
ncbi:hypothetical protein AB0B45_38350 [Nonomuraea sp. NPDC049152]|uniref:hypothetical protein n=1 Tax=Nonomuraea sp. NPDC049152 TaxID=3154350 RepID=UPI0033DD0AB3